MRVVKPDGGMAWSYPLYVRLYLEVIDYSGHMRDLASHGRARGIVFFASIHAVNVVQYKDGKPEGYFDPRNSEKSFLIKPGILGRALTAALAVMPCGAYWLGYHGWSA